MPTSPSAVCRRPSMALLLAEQALNGLQYAALLFLLASGLTLVFGVMNVINLTHGSFYMVGAFCAAAAFAKTGSFMAAMLAALAGAGLYGVAIEALVMRHLYRRDHLDQVLATFGLTLFTNELVSLVFGRTPPFVEVPPLLRGTVTVLPGLAYPVMRLAFIGAGLLVALLLWLLISRTRLGNAGARGRGRPRDGGCAGRGHPRAVRWRVRAGRGVVRLRGRHGGTPAGGRGGHG